MPDRASDEMLLADFCRGNVAALENLALRYELQLLGLARSLLSANDTLARDAVQDAWVKVIKHGSRFDARSSFCTWIYRIVINRCHDLRQQRFRWNGPVGSPPAHPAAADDTHSHPDSSINAHELSIRLRQALELLPDGQRLVLLLCYHHGLTHEQSAAVLGVPLGTLKSRLHSGLESLRSTLNAEPVSPPLAPSTKERNE